MTHAELVALAARWLRGTRKCSLVATERRDAYGDEIPDAIGWTPRGYSVLVECKTSVADFVADLRKPHRCGAAALGRERWYLTERGLLDGREMPNGWGWLEVRDGRVFRRATALPQRFEANDTQAELTFIVAIARRALEGNARGVTLGDLDVEVAT